jgi:hypothetical protein
MENKQIDYIEECLPEVYAPLWWHEKGLSQTASGYGKKLTSPTKVKYNGKLYRVYVICYSNSGSSYIVVKGNKMFLRQN